MAGILGFREYVGQMSMSIEWNELKLNNIMPIGQWLWG